MQSTRDLYPDISLLVPRRWDSVLDEIVFRRIRMEDVVNPFVVNSFYNDCDPDGRTDYVSGPNPQPVDERTPQIKTIRFEDIETVGAHGCVFFIRGLPDSRIKRLSFRNISLTFSPAAHPPAAARVWTSPTWKHWRLRTSGSITHKERK